MPGFDDLISTSFTDLSLGPIPTPISVSSSIPQQNVIVFVSGRTFSISPSLFEQVKSLPWSESGGYKHLNAQPEVFEIILQFFLVGTLPGRVLVKPNKEALSQLVSYLDDDDAEQLKMCIEQDGKRKMKKSGSNSSLGSVKTLSRSNSNSSLGSVKKLLKSPFKTKMPETDEILETVVAKLANVPLSDDLSDLGSAGATSTVSNDSHKENPGTNRKDRKWNLGRRSSSKKLHQEQCESDYIV